MNEIVRCVGLKKLDPGASFVKIGMVLGSVSLGIF